MEKFRGNVFGQYCLDDVKLMKRQLTWGMHPHTRGIVGVMFHFQSPQTLLHLSQMVQSNNLHYIYYREKYIIYRVITQKITEMDCFGFIAQNQTSQISLDKKKSLDIKTLKSLKSQNKIPQRWRNVLEEGNGLRNVNEVKFFMIERKHIPFRQNGGDEKYSVHNTPLSY